MFGLSFLYPLFLAAAAAAAIPIVLHLFRRRTEIVVDFPAVRLLQKAPVEQQRRRRLRELILLVLRVTALLLLAFAFARPYFTGANATLAAPVTIVALDTSMSLSAPGQFDTARQAARRAIESTPPTHTVGLVTFADSATVVVPPTTDRGGILAALAASAPGAGGTRYRTALARAAEAIGVGEGRIVVITDLQQAGWDASDEGAVPDRVSVEVMEVRAPPGNLAVTAVRREGQAVIAAVHNFGLRSIKAPIRLRVDDRDIVSQLIEIAPQAAAESRLRATLPPRGAAEVRVEDEEGYQYDNARYMVLDPPAALPVTVLTADPPRSSNAGLYIDRALAVADEGRAFQVRVIDGRAFSQETDPAVTQPAAMIVLGTRTVERKGRDAIASYLRGGGRVLLTLGPDVDLETLRDTVGLDVAATESPVAKGGTVTLIAVDARHPIFRPFLSPSGALGDVYFEQYRHLTDQVGRVVLARFSGGAAALTEQTIERGRLLIFASDLENRWNRFPLNPAFVPFAVESVRYLTQGREQRQTWIVPDVPPGVSPVPGVHTVLGTGPKPESRSTATAPEQRVAINVDVKESNPARNTVEEFGASVTRINQASAVRTAAEAREQEERQRLWQLGLLVMFVALAGEGLVGRRAV